MYLFTSTTEKYSYKNCPIKGKKLKYLKLNHLTTDHESHLTEDGSEIFKRGKIYHVFSNIYNIKCKAVWYSSTKCMITTGGFFNNVKYIQLNKLGNRQNLS